MNRYKELMHTHFSSCRLLAHARDMHRDREVRIYMIPGDFSIVGVTDGTDSWVCGTNIQPFSIDVNKLIERIRAGEVVPVAGSPNRPIRERRRATPSADEPREHQPGARQRRPVTAAASSTTLRRERHGITATRA